MLSGCGTDGLPDALCWIPPRTTGHRCATSALLLMLSDSSVGRLHAKPLPHYFFVLLPAAKDLFDKQCYWDLGCDGEWGWARLLGRERSDSLLNSCWGSSVTKTSKMMKWKNLQCLSERKQCQMNWVSVQLQAWQLANTKISEQA